MYVAGGDYPLKPVGHLELWSGECLLQAKEQLRSIEDETQLQFARLQKLAIVKYVIGLWGLWSWAEVRIRKCMKSLFKIDIYTTVLHYIEAIKPGQGKYSVEVCVW